MKVGKFLKYLSRRIAQGFVILIGVIVINFLLLQLAPGDAVDILAGEAGGAADATYHAELREKYGLDLPVGAQLGQYIWNVAKLDLGWSFRNNMSVVDLILSRLSPTLLLMTTSIVLATAFGALGGVLAAWRVNTTTDNVISVAALLFYATPIFWLGLMLITLFSVKLGLLPSGGMYSVGTAQSAGARVLDIARHLVMPAMTLALFYMAVYVRLMRASMLEIATLDYVRTARAKGVSERRVMVRHVLRNALLPLVTMVGVQVGSLLGGAVVVEIVFGWPGLGRLALDAILSRDLNLLLGILLICSVLVIAINLVVDLLYTRLDPRIELA